MPKALADRTIAEAVSLGINIAAFSYILSRWSTIAWCGS